MNPQPLPAAPSLASAPVQQPQQPAQPQAPQPRFVFTVTDGSGQSGTVDEHFVAQQLAQSGRGVKSVSPDGAHIVLVDAEGEYEAPVRGLLAGLGWQVTDVKPTKADYDNVQPGWRASLSNLPDDVQRQAYLQKNMAELGMPDARLEGAGDNWFVHNPQTGDWVALTNKPGFDVSDILPGAMTGAHAIGAGAASLAAIESGPGAFFAGIAGGAGTEAAMRGVNAMVDPNFRAVAGENMEGQLKDVGISAAGDAAGGLLGAGLGAGLKRLAGPAVARALSTPASSAATGFGAVAKPVGRGVAQLGAAADTQMGRYLASSMVPGAGGAVNAGFLAQVPAMAMRLPTQAVASAAGSKLGQRILGPKLGQSIEWGANHILNAPSTSSMFGRAANMSAAPFRQPTTASRAAFARDFSVAKAMGLDGPGARAYARARGISRLSKPGNTAFDVGKTAGTIPEGLEAVGRPLERFGLGMTGIATKGLKYGGKALEAAGQMAERAGNYAKPFEPYLTREPLTERFIADPLRDATAQPWGAAQRRRTLLAEEGM